MPLKKLLSLFLAICIPAQTIFGSLGAAFAVDSVVTGDTSNTVVSVSTDTTSTSGSVIASGTTLSSSGGESLLTSVTDSSSTTTSNSGVTTALTDSGVSSSGSSDILNNSGAITSVDASGATSTSALDTPSTTISGAIESSGTTSTSTLNLLSTNTLMSVNALTTTGNLAVTTSVVPQATNPDGSPKLIYKSGDSIIMYASFETSGDSITMNNVKTRITIPKAGLKAKPVFSASDTALSKVESEDANNYYATYTFATVTGGARVAIPVTFVHDNPYVPDGFQTPVKYEFMASDGTVLSTATETVTASAVTMKPIFQIWNSSYVYPDYPSYSPASMAGQNPKMITINGQPTAIANLPVSSGATLTATGTSAPYVQYMIGYYASGVTSDYNGVYTSANNKFTVKLPDGAYFNPTNGNNSSWIYNAVDNTVTYSGKNLNQYRPYNSLSAPEFFYKDLYLQFPGQPLDKIYQASATLVRDAGLPTESTNNLDWYNTWKPVPEIRNFTIAKVQAYMENVFYWYSGKSYTQAIKYFILSGGDNNSNNTSSNYYTFSEIEDYNMNPNLYYYSLRTISTTPSYKLYGVLADTSESLIASGSGAQNISIKDEAGKYTKLIIRFDQPYSTLTNGRNFSITLGVGVKQQFWESITDANFATISKNFDNSMKVTYTDSVDGTSKTLTSTATKIIAKASANVMLEVPTNQNIVYNGNNQISLILNSTRDPYDGGLPIQSLYNLVLLPKGIEFVKPAGSTMPQPDIIPNYKNTGKTAYIFSGSSASSIINVTKLAAEGSNTIEHYAFWPDQSGVYPNAGNSTQIVPDTLDFDEDGNTKEQFVKQVHTINFIPPREIIAFTDSSTTKNFQSSDVIQEIDKTVNYRASVFNNSLTPVSNLTLITALPYPGDHTLVPDKNGVYAPRGSQFTTPLTASLESVPENAGLFAKWDVYYSTDPQGPSIDTTKAANYVTADKITDWSQVKLIKMVLKPGVTLDVKEEAGFIIPAKVPNDTTIPFGGIARTTTAISFNGGIDYNEGLASTVRLASYKISGNIFNDVNKNGEKDGAENYVSNYDVTIKDEAGTVIGTTKTTATGSYSYNIFHEGKYFAEIGKKTSAYDFSPVTVTTTTGNNARVDSADTSKAKTDLVSFAMPSPATYAATKNFGIIIIQGTLTVHKKDSAGNNLEGVIFQIEKDGQKVGSGYTTDNNGLFTVPNLDFGTYNLIEENALPAYKLDTTPRQFVIDENNLAPTVEVVNEKQLWNIKIVKTRQDGSRLEGATFELQKPDGTRVGNPQTTPANGEIIFTGIEYGDYKVVETAAPAGYIETAAITVPTTSFNKNSLEILLNIENKTQYWNIKVIKKDEAGNPLAGATFALQDTTGKQIGNTEVTPASGEIVFTNIARGDYKIIETSAPAGYVEAFPVPVAANDFIKTETEVIKNIVNKKQYWNIKINKIDENGTALSGATFELQKPDGTRVGEPQVTPASGEIIFKDIEYGEYKVVETSSPAGYIEAEPIVLDTGKFAKNITEVALTVIDATQYWNIKIHKTKEDGTPLAGAVFELRDETGKIVGTPQTSDAEGNLIFTKIPRKNYKIVETSSPAGYVEANPVDVVVNDFQKNISDFTKNIVNKTQLWNLKIVKTGKNDVLLPGASFELRDMNGKVVRNAQKTDKNGEIIFTDLTYNDYIIAETEAPIGYLPVENINIKKERFLKNAQEITEKISDKKQLWNIKVIKKDEDTLKVLPGVEFELQDTNGNTVSKSQKTDKNGEIIFPNIEYGDYSIVEKKPLDGYYEVAPTVLTGGVFEKNISEISRTIYNKRIPITGAGGPSTTSPNPSILQPTTGGIEQPLFSAPILGNICVSAVTNIDDPKVEGYYSDISVEDTSNIDRFLTRAEFLKLLLNAGHAKIQEISKEEQVQILSAYSDIDTNSWYAPYIAFAVREGIMSGQNDTENISRKIFRPDDTLSRSEAAKILTQVTLVKDTKLPIEVTSFIDVNENNSLARYIENAYRTCLLHGTNARDGKVLEGEPGRKFSPDKSITLGETAKILYNMSHSTLDGIVNNIFGLQ